jgi:hypothetical protein
VSHSSGNISNIENHNGLPASPIERWFGENPGPGPGSPVVFSVCFNGALLVITACDPA